MKNKKTILLFITLINVSTFNTFAQSSIVYDVVLSGGRVIDPETKLDAIKNVGIINNHIAQIGSETLQGKEIINVKFSEGIEYVMVNGNFVLRNGKTVNKVFPGRAVYGKFKK